ncbi:MAG: hypothetical protein HQ526_09995 [Actinobacteria bacterium]|nr:hypothetical protein [Actinomycetota bacterium]
MIGHKVKLGGVLAVAVLLVGCSQSSSESAPAPGGDAQQLPSTVAPGSGESTLECRVGDERLTEISGIAASFQHPGILWTHNDSGGGPRVYALDSETCEVRATVTMSGVEAVDVEAIAVGQNSAGDPIIWVADIGGNTVRRSNVWLHSFAEPEQLRDQQVEVTSSAITYSDEPGDSESLLVESKPNGRMWIVSKRQSSQGKFYALPEGFGPSSRSATVRPVGAAPWLATDASFSPRGDQFVVRTYLGARMYQGVPPGDDERGLDVPSQGQGEAITFSTDASAVYTISEGSNSALWRTPIG